MGQGKAPYQGGDIFYWIEPGGDAHHHRSLVGLQAHALPIGCPVQGRGAGGEVDAVIDGEELVRVKAPGDQQIGHGVGHTDAVVQPPQGDGVDGAVGDPGERAAQIIQPVVGVDGADHRQAGGLPQQGAHQIAPGAVTVEDLIPPLHDHFFQRVADPQQVVPRQDHRGDTQLPGLLRKGTFHKTHHGYVNGAGEILQQGVDVGLGPAAVSAGNEVHDLHGIKSSKENTCVSVGMYDTITRYHCTKGDLNLQPRRLQKR